MTTRLKLTLLAWILCQSQIHRIIAKPDVPKNRSHTLINAETCVGECAFSFASKLKSELGSGDAAALLNLNYNELLITFSNSTFFEGFCKFYHAFQFCYVSCPHSYMQELLLRSAAIVDHFCVYYYKEIRTNFGCLSKLNSSVSKQCLQQCTPHHNAVSSLMHNFRHLALNGDSSEAEKYLNESCEYVICTMHCDLPTIAHICGFDTANLVVNLTRRAFTSMESLALDTGAVSKWPSICTEVKTYRFPNPQQKSLDIESSEVPPTLETPKTSETAAQPMHAPLVSLSDANTYSLTIILFINLLVLN